jgi:hypothetical protein
MLLIWVTVSDVALQRSNVKPGRFRERDSRAEKICPQGCEAEQKALYQGAMKDPNRAIPIALARHTNLRPPFAPDTIDD